MIQGKVATVGESHQLLHPIDILNVSPHLVAYIPTFNPNQTLESPRKSPPYDSADIPSPVTSVLKTSHPPPPCFLLLVIQGTVPTADQTPPGPHPPPDPSLPPREDLE